MTRIENNEQRHVFLKNDVFISRWYILSVISLLTCIQNAVWSGWGPIAQSAKAVYLWTDTTVDMLVNAGNIATLVLIIPASWLLDVKGLRVSVVIASVTIAIGTGLRCITSEPNTATWLIFTGQTLNGVGGTVTFAAPPLLSETWFPLKERATATAIGIVFSMVGGSLSSVLGPQVVSEPTSCENNTTNSTLTRHSAKANNEVKLCRYIYDFVLDFCCRRPDWSVGIWDKEFGVAGTLALIVLVYFPDKPPTPPSTSAQEQRMTFTSGLRLIARHLPFWHIAITFALPLGVMGSWGSTLDVTLSHFNISQQTAGWLVFYGSLGGTFAGIILSRFADIFQKRMKFFLILVFTLATILLTFFILIVSKFISGNTALIYVMYIGGSTLVNSSMPLFYEMACETAYPAAEGVVAGCMTLVLNLSGSIVLLLSLVPSIGATWMKWALITALSLTIPLLIGFKVQYNRMDIDLYTEEEITVNQ